MKYVLISFILIFSFDSVYAVKKTEKAKKPSVQKEKKLDFSSLVKKAEKLNSGTLLITQDKKFLVEKNWESPLSFYYLQGITPSIVVLALGSLLDEGKIALDSPLGKWIPEWIDPKGQIKISQLLNHTSGFTDNEKDPWYKTANTWAWARLQNPTSEPGKVFIHSDTNYILLGLAVSKTTDKPVEDLVTEKILKPLKIQKWNWDKDKIGHTNVAGGLRIRNYDLLKIGSLVADKGMWDGKKIVSEEWISQIHKTNELTPGYGMGWWVFNSGGLEVLQAFGYQGQHLVIIPEKKIVALRLRNLVPVEQNKEELDWLDFPKELVEAVK